MREVTLEQLKAGREAYTTTLESLRARAAAQPERRSLAKSLDAAERIVRQFDTAMAAFHAGAFSGQAGVVDTYISAIWSGVVLFSRLPGEMPTDVFINVHVTGQGTRRVQLG